MKESILQQKAFSFASNIVLFYEEYSKNHKDNTISKQLLRSGTSVGANINEAQFGNSKNDFIAKLHISLKETGESIYWIKLLKNTNLLPIQKADELLNQAEEIKSLHSQDILLCTFAGNIHHLLIRR